MASLVPEQVDIQFFYLTHSGKITHVYMISNITYTINIVSIFYNHFKVNLCVSYITTPVPVRRINKQCFFSQL